MKLSAFFYAQCLFFTLIFTGCVDNAFEYLPTCKPGKSGACVAREAPKPSQSSPKPSTRVESATPRPTAPSSKVTPPLNTATKYLLFRQMTQPAFRAPAYRRR